MDDLRKIKEKLVENNRIETLLESMNCEYINYEQRGTLITAQLPSRFYSNNKRAVQVRINDRLDCSIRNRPDFKGDIFNLVSYIEFDKRGNLQEDLYNAKTYICELFGWNHFLSHDGVKEERIDYVAPLKAILKGKRKRKKISTNPTLPEEIMNEFYIRGNPIPYKSWIDEGISYRTQCIYGVGFDLESKRIVFPLRNRFGKIVGVKGRIMKTEDDPERKYLYIYKCNNRYEWFNLWIAHPYILMNKKVYIFESEKSCMKAFEYGIYNTLAIGASEISLEQAEIVKRLGLDIDIILCYDKGIKIKEIKRIAEIFKGRNVYGMFDTEDILKDKNSPIDQGLEDWNHLVENNIYPINNDNND